MSHLEEVFARLRKVNLSLKPEKCQFAVKEVKYLGHKISKDGVKMDDSKIKIIKTIQFPEIKKKSECILVCVISTVGTLKTTIKIAVSLNNLLQKDNQYIWTQECQKSFETLRDALTSAPILALPDMSKPFTLTCDASGSAIGYILGQIDENNHEKVISYNGLAIRRNELNWTITEKECLAVVE